MTIGAALLKAREATGMRQSLAAELSGVTRECLCRLERGKSPEPKFHTVKALCKLYGIDMENLA